MTETQNTNPIRHNTHTLVATGLQKHYGSRQVVKGVDLAVKSGEVVGLLGPNGAGKTTSFYMVVGLVVADRGTIELDGKSITHMPIYQRARLGLSYLPQEASVFRRLTVEDNIRAILELQDGEDGRPLSKPEIERRLNMLLEELQIQHIRTSMAMSLSGGERRRTEIARALAANPRFILLDEPFAGVDPIAVIEIQRIVRFLKDRNIGVLITDHNVRETLAICDHAYIINEAASSPRARPRTSSTIPKCAPSISATTSACNARTRSFGLATSADDAQPVAAAVPARPADVGGGTARRGGAPRRGESLSRSRHGSGRTVRRPLRRGTRARARGRPARPSLRPMAGSRRSLRRSLGRLGARRNAKRTFARANGISFACGRHPRGASLSDRRARRTRSSPRAPRRSPQGSERKDCA